MSSTDTPSEPPADDMTVEVRDSRGIPYIQARVIAPNAGEALAKVSSADPDVEWVFLRELSRQEIGQLDQPCPAPAGPAGDLALHAAGTAAPTLAESC